MGYLVHIIDKNKIITEPDYKTCLNNLNEFNQKGFIGQPPCDLNYNEKTIQVSGSFSVSGKYVHSFLLDMVLRLKDLGYSPILLSNDFSFGYDKYNYLLDEPYHPKSNNIKWFYITGDELFPKTGINENFIIFAKDHNIVYHYKFTQNENNLVEYFAVPEHKIPLIQKHFRIRVIGESKIL